MMLAQKVGAVGNGGRKGSWWTGGRTAKHQGGRSLFEAPNFSWHFRLEILVFQGV